MLQTWFRKAAPLALAAAAGAASAAGSVDVRFIDAARFSDAGFGEREIAHTTDTLGQYLQTLGKRLPDGQKLQVEVLDVDLAGWVRPTSRLNVRVLNGRADWPQIRLRYTLLADGRTLQAGEDRVSDMSYLWPGGKFADSGELYYERRMLGRWFNEHFAAP